MVGEKSSKKPTEPKAEAEAEDELPTKAKEKTVRGDDEPIFEDDDDFEHEPKKKSKRARK